MRFQGKGFAVVFMIASALLFSAMQMSSSLCASIPPMEQLFFRNVASILMYLCIRKKGISFVGTKKQQPALFAWSICGAMSVFFLYFAAGFGDQAGLTIIARTSGFMVVIFAAVFLKEKVAKVQYLAVVLAFLGAAMTASPSGGSGIGGNPTALVLAFASATFSALASLFLGLLKNKVHALTVAIHFSLVSLVISFPFVLFDFVMPQGPQWIFLALIGIFGGLGQITQMMSFERAPINETNVFGYSGIIFSMALGAIFMHETLSFGAVAGGGIVILASLWSYWSENRAARRQLIKEN
ncbi:MAG: DMT family transporter [Oscillospiraceae bacterium]